MKDLFMELREEKVNKLCKNLKQIGSCIYNRARFYELAGIDEETCMALEREETNMSFSQYIAIATVIDRINNPNIKRKINEILDRGTETQIGLVEEFYSLFERYETNIESGSYYLVDIAKNYTVVLAGDAISYAKRDSTFRELLRDIKEYDNKIVVANSALDVLKKDISSGDTNVRSDANSSIATLNNMLKTGTLYINEDTGFQMEDEEIISILEKSDKPSVLIMQDIRRAEQIKSKVFETLGKEVKTLTLSFEVNKAVNVSTVGTSTGDETQCDVKIQVAMDTDKIESGDETEGGETEFIEKEIDIFESYDNCTSWDD